MVIDGNRTAQIHRAVPHRIAHHTQGVKTQILTALHLHSLQLLGCELGGIIRLQGERIHSHKGQSGGHRALEAEQGVFTAFKGQKEKFLLVLKAEESIRKVKHILSWAVNLTKILGL